MEKPCQRPEDKTTWLMMGLLAETEKEIVIRKKISWLLTKAVAALIYKQIKMQSLYVSQNFRCGLLNNMLINLDLNM